MGKSSCVGLSDRVEVIRLAIDFNYAVCPKSAYNLSYVRNVGILRFKTVNYLT
jgi:hypothetical protein